MKPLTLGAGGFKAQLVRASHRYREVTGSNLRLGAGDFIAQLVRASHRYREVTGANPVEVLTFSGFGS